MSKSYFDPETGEELTEEEHEEQVAPDYGSDDDDDSGGSSGGGSSSIHEKSRSELEDIASSDAPPEKRREARIELDERTDPDPDSGHVIVTGDPSEGEEVEAVGSGDTRGEALEDAASNPEFDADEGTDVDEVEEDLGTDQPLVNPEGEDPEQVQKALEDIAASDEFRGERTGRQAGAAAQSIQEMQDRFGNVDITKEQQSLLLRAQRNTGTSSQNNTRTGGLNRIPSQDSSQQEQADLIDQGVETVESFFGTGAEIVQGGSDLVESGVNTFSDLTGIETPDAPDTPEVGIPGTDFEVDVDNIWMGNQDQSGDLVLDSAADPNADPVQEFDNFSEDLRDTGLQVMEAGQGVGDRFAEVAPNTNEILLKGAGDVTGIEEFNEAGEAVGEITDSLQRGVGTVGTQAAGFFTAGAGSFGILADDFVTDPIDTSQRFGAGTMQFVSQTGSQFTSSPVQFVAEEGGEEVSEAAIGALVAGPAGAAFGATPTVTPEPEVEPEFNPEVEPEAEPETTTEVEPEEEPEFGPDEVTMEQLPSGFTQVQEVETNVEPVQTDLVEEPAPGVEVRRTGEGETVYPDQPRAEEFDFQVGEETAGARATPTEPDRVNDPGEFRGEDPRTGFTDVEQEIVREVRQREDVTIRQGDTIDETPPGQNEPDPDQTVIEAEETETGGELLFSVMGPVPPSLVEPETETEINPQPDIQGPDPELADVSPDVDVGNVGPEVEFEPETETEVRVEPETEVEPEVDQSVEPAFDPVIDQREETGQDFEQTQTQEFREEQAPEVTEDRPPEPGPDKIMDFAPDREPEVFPDLRPEPEFEPEPDRTPDRDFGSEDSPFSREAPADEEGGEAEPEFRPSLEAVLFDVEGESPGDDEVLTGTEVRPIPEDMEEEFDFPF